MYLSCSLPLVGRAGEGVSVRLNFTQDPPYLVHHLLNVLIQRLVSKANHAIALLPQPLASPPVVLKGGIFKVLGTIELNNQPVRETNKVNHTAD